MAKYPNQIDARAALAEVLGGGWMVLVGGIQWAPAGQPRDLSGAGSATWPTRKAALESYRAADRRLPDLV